MSKNSKLKKKIGSEVYNYLNRNFNDDFLAEHLPSIFGVVSDIRNIETNDFSRLKTLLNQKLEVTEQKTAPTKTAKQLLDEAGFILIDDIQSKKDYLKYKKYYTSSKESLCKFSGYDATSRYSRLFWILRKDIDNIKRPDKPSRQDEYSTSCMSVGISQDKKNVLQITSRYNSTVSGCDNTYNSNLNNIVEGLTEAFNKDYNLKLNSSNQIEFENFYQFSGKYYHYFYEINGHKYGRNTVDGVIYNPDQYLIFENFILDLKNKIIKTGGDEPDAFVDTVNDYLIKNYKIEIKKGEIPDDFVEKEKTITIFL